MLWRGRKRLGRRRSTYGATGSGTDCPGVVSVRLLVGGVPGRWLVPLRSISREWCHGTGSGSISEYWGEKGMGCVSHVV